jgi:hypothetical protein
MGGHPSIMEIVQRPLGLLLGRHIHFAVTRFGPSAVLLDCDHRVPLLELPHQKLGHNEAARARSTTGRMAPRVAVCPGLSRQKMHGPLHTICEIVPSVGSFHSVVGQFRLCLGWAVAGEHERRKRPDKSSWEMEPRSTPPSGWAMTGSAGGRGRGARWRCLIAGSPGRGCPRPSRRPSGRCQRPRRRRPSCSASCAWFRRAPSRPASRPTPPR